ncbi:MAG: hypothetical protein KDC46_02380 [Thermoleophilia bacterium]|nr:hypothetical protein [Thermoleophilia bacterium]
MTEFYTCPVCGYRYLNRPAWRGRNASDEICPCCSIQFGYEDAAGGDFVERMILHARARAWWIADGCQWRTSIDPPADWNPIEQLLRIGVSPP